MFCTGGRNIGAILVRAAAACAIILVIFGWDCTYRSSVAQGVAGQHTELGLGAGVSREAWSLYSTMTVAPFGVLSEDGLRLRTTGGYGAFRYSAVRPQGGGDQLIKFRGTVSFADLLVGYHQQLGGLTLKLYGGAMATRHVIDPFDPEAEVQGTGVDAKAVLETWWTISEQAWASLDLSYGTLHESYAGRLRLGWRLIPVLSAGVEVAADGNSDGDFGRIGTFLRYEWADGEISASAGMMTDWAGIEKIDTRGGAYGSISWLNRF